MFAERSKTEWRLGFFAPRSSALRRTIIKSFTSAPLVLSNTSDLRESPVFSSVNMDTVGLAGQISADWAVGWRLSSWTGRERPEPVVLGDFQLAPMGRQWMWRVRGGGMEREALVRTGAGWTGYGRLRECERQAESDSSWNRQAQVGPCLRVKVSELLSRDLFFAWVLWIKPLTHTHRHATVALGAGSGIGPWVPGVPGMPTIPHNCSLTSAPIMAKCSGFEYRATCPPPPKKKNQTYSAKYPVYGCTLKPYSFHK